jgi:hypothetical protein
VLVSRALAVPGVLVALLVAAGAAAGCGSAGSTCGRGRCASGEACISIFGDGRKNQGWNDPHLPNVLGEWWCERPCPGGKSCASGECLEDPADSDVVVCATDTVDVEYYSVGKACLCDTAANLCYQDQPVSGYEIIDACVPMHNVVSTCLPNVACQVGAFHPGDTVPAVREFFADNGYEHTYCVAYPSNTFGARLPEGRKVRMYIDADSCP